MASTDSKTTAEPIVPADETPAKPKKAPTPAQRKRAEKAASQTKATAPPADTQTPLAKSSAASASKAVEAVEEAVAKGDLKAVDATPSIPDLFRKGRTIAQIARAIQKGQDVVRAALDEAGVDYTADKNAKAPGATRPAAAAPAASKEWTILSSFNSILAKKIDAKSKRGRIVADLASGQNDEDLQAIVRNLQDLAGVDLARAVNALNATLSAHYARVS